MRQKIINKSSSIPYQRTMNLNVHNLVQFDKLKPDILNRNHVLKSTFGGLYLPKAVHIYINFSCILYKFVHIVIANAF